MAAFVAGELVERFADSGPQCRDRGFGGFAQQRFELGEEHLARVEIGRVEPAPGLNRGRCGRAVRPLWRRSPDAHRLTLWAGRLSMTTLSPGERVGAGIAHAGEEDDAVRRPVDDEGTR